MFRILEFHPAIAEELQSSVLASMIDIIMLLSTDKTSNLQHIDGLTYVSIPRRIWITYMPWLGGSTIRRHITKLRDDGWIFTAQFSETKRDRTLYYTVNMDLYEKTIQRDHKDI